MSVRATAASQYRAIVNRTTRQFGPQGTSVPPEGWIATVRKALGMSGAQLAKRLGVTRARVSQAERAETGGGVTLRTMHTVAEAMGCRFVYAIVPKGEIEEVIAAQAQRKAKALVAQASKQMALEGQSLSELENMDEIERLAREMTRAMPSDLWVDR